MGTALLLITHDNIGNSLLCAAESMMGASPISYKNLVISQHMDIEQGFKQAKQLCRELDEGDGVLVVTDMYGSTPGNIAVKLLQDKSEINKIIMTGANLPMLVRIMNYAHLSLTELAEKANTNESIFIINHSISCD